MSRPKTPSCSDGQLHGDQQTRSLNGRNVFDLMQLGTGAVNVAGVDFENGHDTVVNGLREDFNGFLINGVSNKDLSGGEVNTPIQDTVEEFQQLGLNMSAQYGNSAGSTVNLVTKAGTNALHGSVWEYLRNNDRRRQLSLPESGWRAASRRFIGISLAGRWADRLLKTSCSSSLVQGSRFNTVNLSDHHREESPQWELRR